MDVVLSIGYRVKSQRGIIFRKWANKVLKEYLIQGYSINNNGAKMTLLYWKKVPSWYNEINFWE